MPAVHPVTEATEGASPGPLLATAHAHATEAMEGVVTGAAHAMIGVAMEGIVAEGTAAGAAMVGEAGAAMGVAEVAMAAACPHPVGAIAHLHAAGDVFVHANTTVRSGIQN